MVFLFEMFQSMRLGQIEGTATHAAVWGMQRLTNEYLECDTVNLITRQPAISFEID